MANLEEFCVGHCPEEPPARADTWSFWDVNCWFGGCADPAPEWNYESSDWKVAGGDIMGFGGQAGGAVDQLYLIFNTCGPSVQLANRN